MFFLFIMNTMIGYLFRYSKLAGVCKHAWVLTYNEDFLLNTFRKGFGKKIYVFTPVPIFFRIISIRILRLLHVIHASFAAQLNLSNVFNVNM